MGYCQEEDEIHQTDNADDLKAAIKNNFIKLSVDCIVFLWPSGRALC